MIEMISIDKIDIPELSVYSEQSEIRLYRINEPAPGIFIAESPKVIERALNAGYEPISMLMDEKQLRGEFVERLADGHKGPSLKEEFSDDKYDENSLEQKVSAAEPDGSILDETTSVLRKMNELEIQITVYTAGDDLLCGITGFHLTRGVLCAMKRRKLPSVSEICEGKSRIAVLENVTNPTNAGAIVRSAAALGMDAVLFSHGCTDPLYRRAIRVSMGTVFQIPWTFLPEGQGTEHLKSLGYTTVAMALRDDTHSIDDSEISSREKLAVFLGAEGDGLLQETIDSCDFCVKIPMSHEVDSLNVAAASAVAFWALGKH